MSWQKSLKGDSLSWLLEEDQANPAIRYFTLRDLLDRPENDSETTEAKAAIMRSGPVPLILAAQQPEGYWEREGGGYGKYRGTAWQIIFLGELGADSADEKVRRGCEYLLSHSIASNGGFACNMRPVPSGVIHCLNGNLLASLIRLGYLDEPRVQKSLEWQAQAITGEPPLQYHLSGTSGPEFACAANAGQSCGWGAIKALKALGAVPPERRSLQLTQAIQRGVQFLLSYDIAKANYPFTGNISSTWFKLGFPLSYWSDVLENLAVLAELGYGCDPRLDEAYRWLLNKQDGQGRWKLENSLNGKMWADLEKKGQPSKWITLRVMRVIKAIEESKAGV